MPDELAILIGLEGEETIGIRCSEKKISFSFSRPDWGLQILWGDTDELQQEVSSAEQ